MPSRQGAAATVDNRWIQFRPLHASDGLYGLGLHNLGGADIRGAETVAGQ